MTLVSSFSERPCAAGSRWFDTEGRVCRETLCRQECPRWLAGVADLFPGEVALVDVSVLRGDFGEGLAAESAVARSNRTTPVAASGDSPTWSRKRVPPRAGWVRNDQPASTSARTRCRRT